MKKRACFGWGLGGLLMMMCVCSVFVILGFYLASRWAMNSRPLVLFHNPVQQDRFQLYEGVIIHATARAPGGVSRMELWVNDQLVLRQENFENVSDSFAIHHPWRAETPGIHTLQARAYSQDGVMGLATVAVEVIAPSPEPVAYLVGEGEDIQSIAAQYGVDESALQALNPGSDLGNLTPGDEMLVPGRVGPGAPDVPSDAAPEEGGSSDAGSTSPLWDLPLFNLQIMETFSGHEAADQPPAENEDIPLRLEALGLQTDREYEQVHCYVGLGDGSPLWYPDTDGNQATDESFQSLGGGSWEVMDVLLTPVISWHANQALPLDIYCVGIDGGGTQAHELGRIQLRVEPQDWDGVSRRAVSQGGEGSFSLDYCITSPAGHIGAAIYIDPNMAPPTNLRVEEFRGFGGSLVIHRLLWDYTPFPEEEPIDGFRIYVNNTLQWSVPAGVQVTELPNQWLLPPCGEEYRFTVTAYRQGYPDGPESPHSSPYVVRTEPDDPRCKRQVMVSIVSLKTYNLGGDGNYDVDDVGPIYGDFNINDLIFSFDGRCEGSGICGEIGLSHNSTYDLNRFPWGGSGAPMGILIELEPGFGVEVGFRIMDKDTGWNNDDELVCQGDFLTLETDTPGMHTVQSRQGQGMCEVEFWLGPVGDRPVADPGSSLPQPYLRVDSLTLAEPSQQLQIHISNQGSADWVNQNLTVSVENRAGEQLATQTWQSFRLPAGADSVLEPNGVTGQNAEDFCVILDPQNVVAEEGDMTGFAATRYCPPQPDLSIVSVGYDQGDETLQVRVRNNSLVPIRDRTIELQVYLANGTPLFSSPTVLSFRDLAPHSSKLVNWGGFGETQRRQLTSAGYTVMIDPQNRIGESDETNNQATLQGTARLKIRWLQVSAPYYPFRRNSDSPQEQRFRMQVHVGSVSGSGRQVADWAFGPIEIEHGEIVLTHPNGGQTYEAEFDIAGDESLSVFFDANMHYRIYDRFLGYGAEGFGVDENWGVTRTISANESCVPSRIASGEERYLSFHAVSPWHHCSPLWFYYIICRVE